MAIIDQKASFVRFVYPFLFDSRSFEAHAAATEQAQWQGQGRGWPVWQPQPFPNDDLLAHVARYLNPPPGMLPTARLWTMCSDALTSPVVGLGARASWTLILPHDEVPFHIEGVQFALFQIGVGFLTIYLHPRTADVGAWLNVLHYFRFARGQREVGVKAERHTAQHQSGPFFPLPAGGVAQHPDGNGTFGNILDALLATASQQGATDQWWEEVFVPGQLLPFAALFVDGLPAADVAPLVYRVRNHFHAHQIIHPTSADLDLSDGMSLLPYAEGQWFTFSLDGGAFIACDAPETLYFRDTLPAHLGSAYFLLFLLALHQRFALMMLSNEVAKHWLVGGNQRDEQERATAFAYIRDRLLSFTARGYFAQVMQQEHHHRCYRQWQETLQTERLYREVHDEVHEMQAYVQMRQTEQVQQQLRDQQAQMETEARAQAQRAIKEQERAHHLEGRITFLGVVIGAPALISGFLGINLYGITVAHDGLPLWLALLIVAASAFVGAGAVWAIRK